MFGEHGTLSSRKGLCISLRKNRGKSFWILGIPPLPPHTLALRASRILGFILTGSLCTTKSERILSKILKRTDFARAARVVAWNWIVRSDCVVKRTTRASHAPSGRVYKTKNFLTIPISAGGVGGAGKKMERKIFGFGSAASYSHYSHLYYNLLLSQNTIKWYNACVDNFSIIYG